MKYLLFIILLLATTNNARGFEHAKANFNCVACIIFQYQNERAFEAHQLLNKFDTRHNSIDEFYQGRTLLHHCAQKGLRPFVLKKILEKRADPELLDSNGETALLIALRAGNHAGAKC